MNYGGGEPTLCSRHVSLSCGSARVHYEHCGQHTYWKCARVRVWLCAWQGVHGKSLILFFFFYNKNYVSLVSDIYNIQYVLTLFKSNLFHSLQCDHENVSQKKVFQITSQPERL